MSAAERPESRLLPRLKSCNVCVAQRHAEHLTENLVIHLTAGLPKKFFRRRLDAKFTQQVHPCLEVKRHGVRKRTVHVE